MNSLFANMKANPVFWEVAFIFAILLLIGSHKLALEGMIE